MMTRANYVLKRLESTMTVDNNSLMTKISEEDDNGAKLYVDTLPVTKTNVHTCHPNLAADVDYPHLQDWITYIQYLAVSTPTNTLTTMK